MKLNRFTLFLLGSVIGAMVFLVTNKTIVASVSVFGVVSESH